MLLEVESNEDDADVIVPLNADIRTIDEGNEGGLARQAMVLRAAITIQRNFRKYLERKRKLSTDNSVEVSIISFDDLLGV